jgi:hypothetical protein
MSNQLKIFNNNFPTFNVITVVASGIRNENRSERDEIIYDPQHSTGIMPVRSKLNIFFHCRVKISGTTVGVNI